MLYFHIKAPIKAVGVVKASTKDMKDLSIKANIEVTVFFKVKLPTKILMLS